MAAVLVILPPVLLTLTVKEAVLSPLTVAGVV